MKYKLKCLLHEKISFGNVGQNRVCVECDCGNMIYCQNERQKVVQQVIESRIKCRREIKRIQQQKHILNLQSRRLEYQYEFQEEETTNLQQQSRLNNQQYYLDNQLIQFQNKHKIQQVSKQQQNQNNQLLLDEFENLCKQELEEIINAEFIIYHMNRRKKWSIENPMQIEQALLQIIRYFVEGHEYECKAVGNNIIDNKPLDGYYIVYTYSIIYDGYWKNGKLIDGTSTYFEDIGYYKSYDAKQLINKSQIFQFSNYCTFYHSIDDHIRYADIHNQQLQALQCNNPKHQHGRKCNHSHNNHNH